MAIKSYFSEDHSSKIFCPRTVLTQPFHGWTSPNYIIDVSSWAYTPPSFLRKLTVPMQLNWLLFKRKETSCLRKIARLCIKNTSVFAWKSLWNHKYALSSSFNFLSWIKKNHVSNSSDWSAPQHSCLLCHPWRLGKSFKPRPTLIGSQFLWNSPSQLTSWQVPRWAMCRAKRRRQEGNSSS